MVGSLKVKLHYRAERSAGKVVARAIFLAHVGSIDNIKIYRAQKTNCRGVFLLCGFG